MLVKQIVQKRNCLYCFTQTHFICKNTAIPSKKKKGKTKGSKVVYGTCGDGKGLDKKKSLSFEHKTNHNSFQDFTTICFENIYLHCFP